MTRARERRVWAIVPAAGRGARFTQSSSDPAMPKQYAALRGANEILGGAVLAAPIVDTVKRESSDGVVTVDREGLWRALTPQAFPLAALRRALEDAARAGAAVTDEAQAAERMGHRAVLVAGS